MGSRKDCEVMKRKGKREGGARENWGQERERQEGNKKVAREGI